MVRRAYGLVIVLLALASMVGFTSAARTRELVVGSSATRNLDGDAGLVGEGEMYGPDGATSDGSAVGTTSGPIGGGGTGSTTGAEAGKGGGTGSSGGGGTPTRPDAPPVRVAYIVINTQGLGAFTGTDTQGREEEEAGRQNREFRALIDHANATGGIGGRRIEAKRFELTIAELADEQTLIQRCVEITEDYKAQFVVDTTAFQFPSSQSCFAQHRTVLAGFATGITDESMAAMAPYVATTWATVDRQYAAWVPTLQRLNFFDNARIGVFLDEVPEAERTYQRVLEPALTAAGVTPVAIARARWNESQKHANAVLRFREANVTHVLFGGTKVAFLGFSNAAEAQTYRPRYAFTDYYGVSSYAASSGNLNQMRDAVVASACDAFSCVVESATRSSTDFTSPIDRSTATPGLQRCLDTLSQARKVDYYNPQQSGMSTAVALICDSFFLFLDAARAVGAGVNADNWRTGLQTLGRSYLSSITHVTDFRSRMSGAAKFAGGVFNPTCRCYVRGTPWADVS